MQILMKSKPVKVVKTRKTRAEFWKDVKEGDILLFSQYVKAQGSGRGLYAVDVKIWNITQGTTAYNTMNQVIRNMDGYEFEEASK